MFFFLQNFGKSKQSVGNIEDVSNGAESQQAIVIVLIPESSEPTTKSCWDYGKLENPYSKLENPYSKLESSYSKLESTYGKLESPYSKLESHYSKLDSPYSKLESHYTSSLTSQHFNNIKMDPQQG